MFYANGLLNEYCLPDALNPSAGVLTHSPLINCMTYPICVLTRLSHVTCSIHRNSEFIELE